jgi:hypothetical protein
MPYNTNLPTSPLVQLVSVSCRNGPDGKNSSMERTIIGEGPWTSDPLLQTLGYAPFVLPPSQKRGIAIGKGFPAKSAECCSAFWLESPLPARPIERVLLPRHILTARSKALRAARKNPLAYTMLFDASRHLMVELVRIFHIVIVPTFLNTTIGRTPHEIG